MGLVKVYFGAFDGRTYARVFAKSVWALNALAIDLAHPISFVGFVELGVKGASAQPIQSLVWPRSPSRPRHQSILLLNKLLLKRN